MRQIMWRFADRFDVQMLVQSTRAVARGPVAHMVANGARNTHEWTKEKNEMLKAYDEAGITSAFMNLSEGGYLEGRKTCRSVWSHLSSPGWTRERQLAVWLGAWPSRRFVSAELLNSSSTT